MTIHPASEFTSAQLSAVATSAFKNYVGGTRSLTADELDAYVVTSFIHLPIGLVYCTNGDRSQPVALALLSQRDDKPGEVRLAMMGVAQESAGKGIGKKLVQALIAQEKARGTKLIELECITANKPGLNLYLNNGFHKHRQLSGWERDAIPAGQFPQHPDLKRVDIDTVRDIAKKHMSADVPWQAWHASSSPETHDAYQLGSAYAIITKPDNKDSDKVSLATLFVMPEHRRQGHGERMAKALLALCVGKKAVVGAIFPREYSDKMAAKLGFRDTEIQQFQMRMEL